MELWDGRNADGSLAGVDLVRGEPIPEGLYHLVCEVLVRHRDGSVLLMTRDPRKPNYGGYEEATAGGSALKGEEAEACVRRELYEETGLRGEAFTHLNRTVSRNTVYETYLCITGEDKTAVKLQEGETAAFRWVVEAEFPKVLRTGRMIGKQVERYRPYFEAMGWL